MTKTREKAVALIVDIQSLDGMSCEDAQAFCMALGQRLEALREANIQPVWVAIAPGGSKLLEPRQNESEPTQDFKRLEDMGFTGHLPTATHNDIYSAFMKEHGPRANEIIYRKPAMSALATADDERDMERILEQSGIKLESRKDLETDHSSTRYIQPEQMQNEFRQLFSQGITLHDYLAASGVKSVNIFGAVSKYCVAETALSAAAKGYETRIMPDLVLSWAYPVNATTRQDGQLMWSGFDHISLINNAISDAVKDPERSYTQTQKDRIASIQMDSHDGSLASKFKHSRLAKPSGIELKETPDQQPAITAIVPIRGLGGNG